MRGTTKVIPHYRLLVFHSIQNFYLEVLSAYAINLYICVYPSNMPLLRPQGKNKSSQMRKKVDDSIPKW